MTPVAPVRRGRRVAAPALALVALAASSCAGAPRPDPADEAALRALHETVLAAHRSGDVEAWMAIEAADPIVARNGSLASPAPEERRAQRAAYLAATRFSVYRDRRAPIVRVSRDGTLGWVLAEVEIRGTRIEAGVASPVEADYAWIELYEKRDGRWLAVGNVSNRKP